MPSNTPRPCTQVYSDPLWDTPRYYMTVLLSWLQSSRRAKFGIHALEDDFTAPIEPTGRKSRASTGGKGSKATGSRSATGRPAKSGSAKMGPNLARVAGGGAGGGTPVGVPPIEKADMRWLARQRAGSGKSTPATTSTAPCRTVKTKAPARRAATASRADAGKTRLVLRSPVPTSTSGSDKARTKVRSASGNGAVRVHRTAKGDPSRYGYESPPGVGSAYRGRSAPSGSDAKVLQQRGLGALPGAIGTATSASGAL